MHTSGGYHALVTWLVIHFTESCKTMTTYAIGGQSSGDFRETSARVQLLHVVTRNAVGVLTPDAFTQTNPPKVTTQKSTTLATITKVGVLGASVAFTRPDYGNGYHGGPNTASYAAG